MIQVRDFRGVEAQPAMEGVTMRVVIGPEEGAPIFNMRVFEVQPGLSTPRHSPYGSALSARMHSSGDQRRLNEFTVRH